MAAFAAFVNSARRLFFPPAHPRRLIAERRARPLQAAAAGTAAALVFLVLYYLTLPLLPQAFAYPTTHFPVSAFAHRFDWAQFFGTLIVPPIPTRVTWLIGFVLFGGFLAGNALAYAILLSWSLQPSDPGKGAGFGAALFLGLGFAATLANGYHPATMRNTFPDTGLFFLGWSGWAAAQLLVLFVIYGATLGALYQKWTHKA